MNRYVIEPPPVPAITVVGGGLFPARRVYCAGRNYAEHAREMGGDPSREVPFWFSKPADALVPSGSVLPYPMATQDLHHEVELVVAVGLGGAHISSDRALEHVFGYAVGLDLTRRDLQAAAKAKGRPWEVAKGFDRSAPTSAITPRSLWDSPNRGRIWLSVGGQLRQDGDLSSMIWSVPEVIANLSALFELAPGDLIFTGTPAGVGPILPGEEVVGCVEGLPEVRIQICGA